MDPFTYEVARDVAGAVATVAADPGAQFLAGGTSQVDLMKEGVQRPSHLVDVSRLPLSAVEATGDGGLRIGANVTNTAAADHPLVRGRYPAVSEAVHAGASQQIRNVATVAGNLLQRTRCPYLRDPAAACNKRDPGSGCAALRGFNRMHAIFGASDDGPAGAHTCIAAHPSDLAVALAAHEAVILVEGVDGSRRIAFDDLHRLPGHRPDVDTTLRDGDLVIAIELPAFAGRSHYLKVRDRASYAYALVSCAVAVELDGDTIRSARVALGSVAAKPWRARAAETLLVGASRSADLFREAAVRALAGSRVYAMNAYKPDLGRALVERALLQATGLQPLPGEEGTAFAASVGGIASDPVLTEQP